MSGIGRSEPSNPFTSTPSLTISNQTLTLVKSPHVLQHLRTHASRAADLQLRKPVRWRGIEGTHAHQQVGRMVVFFRTCPASSSTRIHSSASIRISWIPPKPKWRPFSSILRMISRLSSKSKSMPFVKSWTADTSHSSTSSKTQSNKFTDFMIKKSDFSTPTKITWMRLTKTSTKWLEWKATSGS